MIFSIFFKRVNIKLKKKNKLGTFNNNIIYKDFSNIPPHSDIGIRIDMHLFGNWPGGDAMNYIDFNINYSKAYTINGS